jgi:peroxiredoxin
MPGFDDRLSPAQIWQLVTFLHALADAQEARRLTGRVGDWRPIVAPDFAFEIAGGEQETLEEQRGRHAVLLVLYAYPQSRTRLVALTKARDTLEGAGVRVIAIPFDARDSAASKADGVDAAMLAFGDPRLAGVYSLLLPELPRSDGGSPERHAEFLVDRSGYLRSVRTDAGNASADRIAELVQDAARLAREPPHPPEARMHMH